MAYDADGNKVCSKCGGKHVPTQEFWSKDKHRSDGLSSYCKSCKALYNSSETAKACRNKYQREHPEQMRRNRRKYLATHREERRAYDAKRSRENIAAKRVQNAKYHAEHTEHVRIRNAKWRAENPEKKRMKDSRRRARKKNLSHTLTASQWRRTLEYFGGLCPYCNKPLRLGQTWAKEHVIPQIARGGWDADNIIPACHSLNGALDKGCNNRKSTRDFREFCLTEFGPKKGQQAIDRILAYFAWVKQQDNEFSLIV
jgi:hypothetical protein